MTIGSVTGSYGMYPFMTRVSVGDRPVTALVAAPSPREMSDIDAVQPHNIPTYSRNGRAGGSSEQPTKELQTGRPLSVFA